jgi:hypothetical protein
MPLTTIGPLNDVEPEFATLDHPVWEEIKRFFSPSEFEAPEKMDVGFLRLLFQARLEAEVPFRILDTLRDDSRSAHGEEPGIAVDLQLLNSRERSRITRAAYLVGFLRVGVYEGSSGTYKGQVKKDGGGLHLDASRTKSSDHMWTMRLP